MTNQEFIQILINKRSLTNLKPNARTQKVLLEQPIQQQLMVLTSFIEIDFSLLERLYLILNNTTTQPKCLFCGANVGFHKTTDRRGQIKTYCNSKCSNRCAIRKQKAETTSIEKYGVSHAPSAPEVRERIESTLLERYGVASPTKATTISEKIKATNRRKYGCDYPLNNKDVQKRAMQSNLDNHSNVLSTQDEKCKQKARYTFNKKYGTVVPAWIGINPKSIELVTNKEWLVEQHHTFKKSFTKIADELKLAPCTVGRWSKTHGIDTRRFSGSLGESKLAEFVASLLPGEDIVNGTRAIIPPQELDIYVPSHNLAIEFNGAFRHSEASGKDKEYHLSKTFACLQQNITLFHFFDFEWFNKPDIVKSYIRRYLGLSDVCSLDDDVKIKQHDSNTAEQFCLNNSLEQIPFDVCYGIEKQEEIYAMLYVRNNNLKYVQKNNVIVNGGFELLFNTIQQQASHKTWLYNTNLRFFDLPFQQDFVPLAFKEPQVYVFSKYTCWDCGYITWQHRND